ncbi:rRNA methyltransferase 1, mitochondrial-like isoform X2 [Homarus americanus]|nr:rRNA methyltransferase 1, mitochondrial-like isoform X2 [Homarus americanus]
MFSKIFIRHASHKVYRLPPVKFRYANDIPSSTNKQAGELPRITSPVVTEKAEKTYRNIQNKSGWQNDKRKYYPNSSDDKPNNKVRSERINDNNNKYNDLDSENTKHYNPDKYFNHERKRSSQLNMKYANRHHTTDKILHLSKREMRNGKNNNKLNFEPVGELIYGVFPVLLALRAQRRKFHNIFYKKGNEDKNNKIQEILETGKKHSIKIHGLGGSEFKLIFKGDQAHQGICCDVSHLLFENLNTENFYHTMKPGESMNLNKTKENELVEHQPESSPGEDQERPHQLWLYLDRIQDPMNFGAVIRSAYFTGVDKVFTPMEHSCRISGVVSKASAGVAEVLPVYQVDDPVTFFSKLSDVGWHLVASSSSGTTATTTSISDFLPLGNTLLVVGNEGTGVSQDLERICKTVVTIPSGRVLDHDAHCLNVSAATAVILHHLQTKLKPH